MRISHPYFHMYNIYKHNYIRFNFISGNFQYYLMDIGNSPWHYVVELLQLLELIFGVILIWSLISCFFCFICFLEFNCLEIEQELAALKYELNIARRHRNLAHIVGHHCFVILFWKRICDLFQYPLFGILIVAGVNIGLIGIALLIVN